MNENTWQPVRVHARHHVLDRAVLARGVHRLEDQQQRPAILRVEHLLQLAQALDVLRERRPGLLLFESEGVLRVDAAQRKPLPEVTA